GQDVVVEATVDEIVPPDFETMIWTCSVNGSDVCGAPIGIGDIHTTVTLGAGATATFTLTHPQGAGSTAPVQLPWTETPAPRPAAPAQLPRWTRRTLWHARARPLTPPT